MDRIRPETIDNAAGGMHIILTRLVPAYNEMVDEIQRLKDAAKQVNVAQTQEIDLFPPAAAVEDAVVVEELPAPDDVMRVVAVEGPPSATADAADQMLEALGGLRQKIITAVVASGMTLGELMDTPMGRLTDIRGIGPGSADTLYRHLHPDEDGN